MFDTWGGTLVRRRVPRVLARLSMQVAGRHPARREPAATCRASCSPRAAASGWRRWPVRAPTRWASTGRPTSATRASASATGSPCRATWIRWRFSARPRRSRPRRGGSWDASAAGPGHVFNLGHGVKPAHAAGARARARRGGPRSLPRGRRRPRSCQEKYLRRSGCLFTRDGFSGRFRRPFRGLCLVCRNVLLHQGVDGCCGAA